MVSERILFVDDEEPIRKAFARTLRRAGFKIDLAGNFAAAMSFAARTRYAVIVLDFRMPGHNGFELKEELEVLQPDASYILLSGDCGLNLTLEAVNDYRYEFVLQKPWVTHDLVSTLNRALENHWERATAVKMTANMAVSRGPTGTRDPRKTASAQTRALLAALELHSHEAHLSGGRVRASARLLAAQMALSADDQEVIASAAALRDIGQIAIPDAILDKTTPLTDDDWVVLREHPDAGAQLLGDLSELSMVRSLVAEHHEHWDGGGYPHQFKGNQIALGARIIAIADTYEAIVSDRPYRRGASHEVARDEIARRSGSQFDPAVVRAFMAIPASSWTWARQQGEAEMNNTSKNEATHPTRKEQTPDAPRHRLSDGFCEAHH